MDVEHRSRILSMFAVRAVLSASSPTKVGVIYFLAAH